MNIDPVTVSLSALGVSILSLLITVYRGGVENRLKWEQMRGRAYTRLTSRCVELLAMIEDLRHIGSDHASDVIVGLLRVLQGLVETRRSLNELQRFSWLFPSRLSVQLAPITSALDDAEVVLEALGRAVQKRDLLEARKVTDGLIQRIWGSKGEPDAAPNSRPSQQLPTSPEVQSPDSQRTPSSGGCG